MDEKEMSERQHQSAYTVAFGLFFVAKWFAAGILFALGIILTTKLFGL